MDIHANTLYKVKFWIILINFNSVELRKMSLDKRMMYLKIEELHLYSCYKLWFWNTISTDFVLVYMLDLIKRIWRNNWLDNFTDIRNETKQNDLLWCRNKTRFFHFVVRSRWPVFFLLFGSVVRARTPLQTGEK